MTVDPDRRWDVFVLTALTAFNLWLASPAFGDGLLADNDFVGHYAYTRLLADSVWPLSGSATGWSPRFNLGAPFLLFNPPPLLYVAAAATSKLLGVTPLIALKGWLVAAYLAVPLSVYLWCRELEGRASNAPLFAALLVSLFSSELFGLDFFFRNGMANAAAGVPLMVLVWAAYTRAIKYSGPAAIWAVGWGSVAFCLLVLTHLSSAYMACLGMACMALVDTPKRWGGNVLKTAGVISVGLLLSGMWLIPSLPFAPDELVVRTWLRNPVDVARGFLLGDIFSAYHAAFFHRFRAYSTIGAVALLAGALGTATATQRREWRVLGVAVWSLLALWVTMGPRVAYPLVALPLYDQLLWYRFLTPVILCWLVVGGFGVARLLERDEPRLWKDTLIASGLVGGWLIFAPHWLDIPWPVAVGVVIWLGVLATRRLDLIRWANPAILAGILIFAILPDLAERSGRILTTEHYSEEVRDVERVSEWLRENADPTARTYGEFLNNNVSDSVSVNYLRHIIPTETGLDEVAGWIYETNPASSRLQARGLFWYTPLPMIEEYAHYDVKYVTATSPNFQAALSQDPRWELALMTPSVQLYQAKNFVPQRVFDPSGQYQIAALERGYDRKGDWRIGFDIEGSHDAGFVVVKTNYVSAWRAEINGLVTTTSPTEDGMLLVKIPPSERPAHVELRIDLDSHHQLGWWLTAVGAALMASLLGLGLRYEKTIPLPGDGKYLAWVGIGIAVVVTAACVWDARDRDASTYVFGLTNGMVTGRDAAILHVGAYDDVDNGGLNFVLAPAWEERTLDELTPARVPKADAAIHAVFTASRSVPTMLTIWGKWTDESTKEEPVSILIHDLSAHRVIGATELYWGEPAEIPPEILASVPVSKTRPGVPLGLTLRVQRPAQVTHIRAQTDAIIIQGEAFRNHPNDKGEASYFAGRPFDFPHDGATLTGSVTESTSPVRAVYDAALPEGEYTLWARMYGSPESWRETRAEAWFLADRKLVGAVDGVGRVDDDKLEFVWEEVGTMHGGPDTQLEVYFGTDNQTRLAWADLDAIALVPVSP